MMRAALLAVLFIVVAAAGAVAGTVVGVNPQGLVVIEGDGSPTPSLPATFNGQSVELYSLTPQQAASYQQLSQPNGGVTFNGTTFSALPLPPQSPAQAAAALQSGGFAVSCAANATVCTSAIAGTYAVDPTHNFFITSEATSILQNGTFTNGQTTKAWPDTSGAVHTFSLSQWKEFDTAVAAFIDAVNAQLGVAQGGGTPSWPSASAELE